VAAAPAPRARGRAVRGDRGRAGHLLDLRVRPPAPERSFLLKYDGRRWTTLRGRASGQKRKVRLQAVSHVSGLTVAVGHLLDAKDRYTDHVERYETQPAK